MRINQNMSALSAYRNLTQIDGQLSKSLERLSSGLRINRAADDAAGLAISEKMTGQVRGLGQAMRNAQDGISLIQTAEGALIETHAILQRMRELAVQSANDTQTDTDRIEIQKEVDALSAEITRIGNTTEFNTKELLNGKFEGLFHIGANEGQNISLSVADMRADALGVAGNQGATFGMEVAVTLGAADRITDGTYSVIAVADYTGTALDDANVEGLAADVTHVMVDADGEAIATSADGLAFHQVHATALNRDSFEFAVEVSSVTIGGTGTTAAGEAVITDHSLDTGTYTLVDLSTHAVYGGTWNVGLQNGSGEVVALGAADLAGTAAAAGAELHWVDVNDTSVSLLSFDNANAGLTVGEQITVSGAGINVSSQSDANTAITTIQTALDNVSSERSKLGAIQNRLEHTIANLGVAAENITAARSRIQDVDMAHEMMNYTKNQILSQAGTAMLAQANQKPQTVLQLLR
ncbi:MAG: flagellin [Clostridiales bacterium]|jgi:flagellin|nr:flagellin [Clostridiales bacterium]